ncbi:DUF1080 domain-containing protein [Alcanivorax sp. 1008]|nr:DUF1080 domain-containing protein [Alcanivorax sp. 1008]
MKQAGRMNNICSYFFRFLIAPLISTALSGYVLAASVGVPDYDCSEVWQSSCAPGGQYGGWERFNFYNDFEKYWNVYVTGKGSEYYAPLPRSRYAEHGITYNRQDQAIEIDTRGKAILSGEGHGYINLEYSNQFEGNFEFITQFRALEGNQGNSGIQFASQWQPASADNPNRAPNIFEIQSMLPFGLPQGGWMNGPQVDVHAVEPQRRLVPWDIDPGPMRTGLIFDETRDSYQWLTPKTHSPQLGSRVYMREDQALSVLRAEGIRSRADHPYKSGGQWNTLYIRYEDGRVTTALNGRVILRNAEPHYYEWWWKKCYLGKNRECGVSRPGRISFQLHVSKNPFENRHDWGLAGPLAPFPLLMLPSKEQDALRMQYRGVHFREF